MASVSLHNVTKVYDGRARAVCELTLDVRDGELMVLVGPSGCGKTTILRLIAGLERATSGSIHIAGRPVDGLSPRDRDVAMVFQDGVLYPHMSVYDNLAFPLRMRKFSGDTVRRRVERVVASLGIADLTGRKPTSLSGGQRRRVALGRAIVREPAVFLFDEPLTNLDAALHSTMRSEIKLLHQTLRTTTLYVTHDHSEAMALGERLCVLCDGRVQQVGSPHAVYDRPSNRFVAGFFGTPAMNLLGGRVRVESETVFVDLGREKIGLSAPLQSRLRAFRDDEVMVGVRPHDLSLTSISSQAENVLAGQVSSIEPLGSRAHVRVQRPSGDHCVVVVPPHTDLSIGDEVAIHIDPDRIHVFELGPSGRNIASDVTPAR